MGPSYRETGRVSPPTGWERSWQEAGTQQLSQEGPEHRQGSQGRDAMEAPAF